jgi:hypothetical protein
VARDTQELPPTSFITPDSGRRSPETNRKATILLSHLSPLCVTRSRKAVVGRTAAFHRLGTQTSTRVNLDTSVDTGQNLATLRGLGRNRIEWIPGSTRRIILEISTVQNHRVSLLRRHSQPPHNCPAPAWQYAVLNLEFFRNQYHLSHTKRPSTTLRKSNFVGRVTDLRSSLSRKTKATVRPPCTVPPRPRNFLWTYIVSEAAE